MKKIIVNCFIILVYGAALLFAGAVVYFGWSYYTLTLLERPHHTLHSLLKPGGLWGHGLGIIGSCMILLLFLYSARKRDLFFLRFGRMSSWLNVHIFFGIIGPILITLHTAMKFNGIIMISYISMLAVMFSGIFGRYIYMQIPRDSSGDTLTLEQISSQDNKLTRLLSGEYGLPLDVQHHIQQITGTKFKETNKGVSALVTIINNDLKRPFLFRNLHSFLIAQNGNIPPMAIKQILHIAKQKSLLLRRRAFLDVTNQIFHYWHVVHKPFAYVMIFIMFLHVLLTVSFGYRWIF